MSGLIYSYEVVDGTSYLESLGTGSVQSNDGSVIVWKWSKSPNTVKGTFTEDCSAINWENNSQWYTDVPCVLGNHHLGFCFSNNSLFALKCFLRGM